MIGGKVGWQVDRRKQLTIGDEQFGNSVACLYDDTE